MTDRYTQLVSQGLGKDVAKKLGLPPQPWCFDATNPAHRSSRARSWSVATVQGQMILPPPCLVGVWTSAATRCPRRNLGGIILVLDAVQHPPGDLRKSVLTAGASLRDLSPNGRVITMSRTSQSAPTPASAAARQGIDGFLRSLAKELRAGGPRPTAFSWMASSRPPALRHWGGPEVLPLGPLRLCGWTVPDRPLNVRQLAERRRQAPPRRKSSSCYRRSAGGSVQPSPVPCTATGPRSWLWTSRLQGTTWQL